MKAREHAHRRTLNRHDYVLMRLDGRAFHTYTRGFAQPHDTDLMNAVDATMHELCNHIPGVRLAYAQSDEISLLITAWRPDPTQPDGVKVGELWMGGVEAKMVSLAAAYATLTFNRAIAQAAETATGTRREFLTRKAETAALFDARVWTHPGTTEGAAEVNSYFTWRQRDCVKNSVHAAAHHAFGHAKLNGVNTDNKLVMLQEHGTPWEHLPQGFRNGRVAVRRPSTHEVTYVDRRTNQQHTTTVNRRAFQVEEAPAFDHTVLDTLHDTTTPA